MATAVSPRASQRFAALLAFIALGATVLIAVAGFLREPLAILISFVAAMAFALGVVLFVTSLRMRIAGAALALLGVLGWAGALVANDVLIYVFAMIATDAVATFCTLAALRPEPYHPPARAVPAARRPFILMNPKSGGGKVEKFDLVARARAMGAEVAVLSPGADLEGLLADAVRNGADLLGAAGGDGTQALVALVAAANGLPMLCIPAGTRNHFALDLGLDRNDPGLVLAAIGDEGEEIVVDLGTVNGRPFVNNVSLGVYAEIVSRPEYREAKLQTTLDAAPLVANPDARSGLGVEAPGREAIYDPQIVQVSNNPYARPSEPAAFGTRPRLDTGLLGIEVIAYKDAAELRQLVACIGRNALPRAEAYTNWTGERITVTANDGNVAAGVDGEYFELPAPLEVTIRAGAVRIRVPKDRPGAKPGWPQFDRHTISQIRSILLGRATI